MFSLNNWKPNHNYDYIFNKLACCRLGNSLEPEESPFGYGIVGRG